MSDHLLKTLAGQAKASAAINNLVRRNPLYYRPAISLIERLSSCDLEERILWSKQQLRGILRRASRTPYGRKHGRGNDIAEWPILRKESVRENTHDFLRYPRLVSAPANTSGSTGIPLRISRSFRSVTVEQAVIDYLASKKGINLAQCKIAVLRGDAIKDPSDLSPPYWKITGGGQKLLLSAHHLMPNTIEDYHEVLARFSPHCLMAYPSALESLSGLLMQHGKRLNIPLVMTSSEQLSPSAWEMATDSLCCEVIDHYGQGERVSFAYAFSSESYYFECSYGYTEFIYSSTADNLDFYEIVGTSLWNTTMPLVRYGTGDLICVPQGTTHDELVKIRYGLAPFTRIEGRSTDYLLSPDGARLIGMNHIPRDVKHIIQAQLIQESVEHVRILIVPTKEFADEDKVIILKNAYAKLPQSMRVDIELVDRLERTAQGKAPFLLRRIDSTSN